MEADPSVSGMTNRSADKNRRSICLSNGFLSYVPRPDPVRTDPGPLAAVASASSASLRNLIRRRSKGSGSNPPPAWRHSYACDGTVHWAPSALDCIHEEADKSIHFSSAISRS